MFCTHQAGRPNDRLIMLVTLIDTCFFLLKRGLILPSGSYSHHLAGCVEITKSTEALQLLVILLTSLFSTQTSGRKFPPHSPSLRTVPSFLQPHPQHPIQHAQNATYQMRRELSEFPLSTRSQSFGFHYFHS